MANSAPQILEVGAGSGVLAAELLLELDRCGSLPQRYLILELSGELRARQQVTLASRAPQLAGCVAWLDALPQNFAGLVLGNEVLDAMPVAWVEWCSDEINPDSKSSIHERGVVIAEGSGFAWANRPAQGAVLQAAQALTIASTYLTEIGLAARAWIAEFARILESGALLLIDYGYPQAEFYHPQRTGGTLMCHYRHRAHDDPLWWPGLNDITAHVDFTAIADAGFGAGLDVLGYTSQAQFLFNCGITTVLDRIPDKAGKTYLNEAGRLNKLISPHEMGELFKVIALGRGLRQSLLGFSRGDRLHTL